MSLPQNNLRLCKNHGNQALKQEGSASTKDELGWFPTTMNQIVCGSNHSVTPGCLVVDNAPVVDSNVGEDNVQVVVDNLQAVGMKMTFDQPWNRMG